MYTRLLGLLLLAAMAVSLVGCTTYTHKERKYILLVEEGVPQPPNRVVRVAADTLRDLNMLNLSGDRTGIDGVFYAHTALGREFRVVIYGKQLQNTRVQIFGQNYFKDREQGFLIMGEIIDRLQRPEPVETTQNRSRPNTG